MRLENEKFLVLGFARSGQAAARALLAEYAQVAACDRRTIAELGSDAADLAAAGVKLYVGSEEWPPVPSISPSFKTIILLALWIK